MNQKSKTMSGTRKNGIKRVDPMQKYLMNYFPQNNHRGAGLILTQSARIEETSMNEIKSIKQYSKLILIEHTEMDHPYISDYQVNGFI